jgi:broad specificity phosphatase PhoE
MTLRLWLVRHGESTWNAARRVQGWADPPLTERGIRQARRVAERLSTLEVTALYTSPQVRAVQTAEAIAAATGAEPTVDARLREHGMGQATGHKWDEIITRWPHLLDYAHRGEAVRPHIPETEPEEEFYARVAVVFDEIVARHDEGDVVIVSHGGTFRGFLTVRFNIPRETYLGLRFGNASVTLAEIERPGWMNVHYVNDTSHLRDGAEGEKDT